MRRPTGKLARALVFVLILGVVVGGLVIVPMLDLPYFTPDVTEYPEYDTGAIVPDRMAAEGSFDRRGQDPSGLVVIDRSHANRFDEQDIEPMLEALAAAGYRVEFIEFGDDFDDAIGRADGVVVIDPGVAYTSDEVDRIERFVDSGGRLVILGEPTRLRLVQDGLALVPEPAPNHLTSLSTRFGIGFGTDYLYNLDRNDGNYRNIVATSDGRNEVTDGVDRIALYTATKVEATDGAEPLIAAEGTRTSRGDVADDFAVAAVSGNVLAIGDSTFLERGNYRVADNARLIGNIAAFLVDESRSRTLLDYPYLAGSQPRITYTSSGLLSPAQTVATDLRGAGNDPTLTLDGSPGRVGEGDVLITTYDDLAGSGIDAGVSMSGALVSVDGYRAEVDGQVVIRAPEGRNAIVIVAEDADGARTAADILANRDVTAYLIDRRTAVIPADVAAPDDGFGLP